MSIIKEFKEFALKGNVVDLAVGVIIGIAFGKVVNSMVQDIMMPLVSFATPGADFTNGKIVLREGDEAAKIPDLTINYGSFISLIIEFFIVALCLFIVMKAMNRLMAAQGSFIPGIGLRSKKPEV